MAKLLLWPEDVQLDLFGYEVSFLHINLILLVLFASSLLALTIGKQQAWYGRYSSTALGPRVPGRIDWFFHGFANATFVVIPVVYGANQACLANPTNRLLIILFNAHYINRSFIHAVRVRDPKPIPLVILLMTSGFCLVNGYLQAVWLLRMHVYEEAWFYSPQFVAGVVTFLLGMYINVRADSILMNLRKPGETGYKVSGS